eukprot:jgi/Galph1/3340/GphlegSOOS_G1958.1
MAESQLNLNEAGPCEVLPDAVVAAAAEKEEQGSEGSKVNTFDSSSPSNEKEREKMETEENGIRSVNSGQNPLLGIFAATPGIEPTQETICRSLIPCYSMHEPAVVEAMKFYDGPYSKLRFEDTFNQENECIEDSSFEEQGGIQIDRPMIQKRLDDKEVQSFQKSLFCKLGDASVPRFWYEPGRMLPVDYLFNTSEKESVLAEVRVAAEYLSLNNPSLRNRYLWGDETYTVDSDLVAALLHSGYLYLGYTSPNTFVELAVLVQIKKQNSLRIFPAFTRSFFQSRECLQREGHYFSIDFVAVVLAGGMAWQLRSMPLGEFNFMNLFKAQNARDTVLKPPKWPLFFKSETVSKTNSSVDDFLPVFFTFNLSHESCLCYSLSLFIDSQRDPQSWLSKRFQQEVVYLETESHRYELSLDPEAKSFRLNLVKNPEGLDYQLMSKLGVPLPGSHVQPVEEGLEWKEIQWGVSKVRIRKMEYAFLRVMLVPRTSSSGKEDTFMEI